MAKQRNRRPVRRRDKRGGPGSGRRKPCPYCKDKIEQVDYKDVDGLPPVHLRARQDPLAAHHRRGRRHESQIARAVKRARELALLPYVAESSGRDDAPRGRGGRDRDRDYR